MGGLVVFAKIGSGGAGGKIAGAAKIAGIGLEFRLECCGEFTQADAIQTWAILHIIIFKFKIIWQRQMYIFQEARER